MRHWIALGASILMSGCLTVDRAGFEQAELLAASPPVRYDRTSEADRIRYLAAVAGAAKASDSYFDVLALSSGAANGAFGAGVLTGWSDRGDRPIFEVVTGVSIGALIAPFAFVGAERDADLAAAFTDGRTNRLLQSRGLATLSSGALFSSRPLRSLIAQAVDDPLLEAIARGHRDGRRLFIATTSLDAREQVIWDIGAVAASERPDRRSLIVEILVAAASIPGAFSPVLIRLENEGRRVDELHADGRLTACFFVAPESVLREGVLLAPGELKGEGSLWIIINGSPEQAFEPMPPKVGAMAARSLEALLDASTRTSLVASARLAERSELAMRVVAADPGAASEPMNFNTTRMNTLYEAGRRKISSDNGWTVWS